MVSKPFHCPATSTLVIAVPASGLKRNSVAHSTLLVLPPLPPAPPLPPEALLPPEPLLAPEPPAPPKLVLAGSASYEQLAVVKKKVARQSQVKRRMTSGA